MKCSSYKTVNHHPPYPTPPHQVQLKSQATWCQLCLKRNFLKRNKSSGLHFICRKLQITKWNNKIQPGSIKFIFVLYLTIKLICKNLSYNSLLTIRVYYQRPWSLTLNLQIMVIPMLDVAIFFIHCQNKLNFLNNPLFSPLTLSLLVTTSYIHPISTKTELFWEVGKTLLAFY